MAELVKRQSSIFESNHPSCMWSFLQLFDFDRIQSGKMIAYRRKEDGRHTGRAKVPKSKLHLSSTVGEHNSSESEENVMMEDKLQDTKSSGKARVRNLISKLYKKQDRKQKISPLASQLIRTISIHHLECNDYVPDGITSDSEISMADFFSHETDSSASNHPWSSDESVSEQRLTTKKAGHNLIDELQSHSLDEQIVIKEELKKTKEYLLKLKDADSKEVERNVPLMLELFNMKRQFFQMDIVYPNSTSANYFQNGLHSSSDIVLVRSRSFPGAAELSGQSGGLLELERKQKCTLVDQKAKSQTEHFPSVQNTIKDDLQAPLLISSVKGDIIKQKPGSCDGAESSSFESSLDSPEKSKKQKDHGNVLTRFKVLKQRIKSAFRDNKKEHRISMDGFLHKIPYGNQIPEDVERENLRSRKEPSSNRFDKDSLGFKGISNGAVSTNSKYKYGTIQRSRSLAESLDRYSRLFESISVGETRRPPERLKSIKEDDRKPQKTWGRITSNPEFGRFAFTKIGTRELSHSVVSSKISASGHLVEDAVVDTYNSVKPEFISTLLDTEDKMKSDTDVEYTVKEDGKQALINECEQSELCKISDDIMATDSSYVPLCEKATSELDSHDKTRPSPISTLDSYFQEDPVSPVKYRVSEGLEMKPGWVTFEEPDSAANYVSNSVEVAKADFDEIQTLEDLTEFGSPIVQVDQNDETKFNYVKEILKKSGFCGKNVLGTWYSPDQPLDPSLFEEANLSPHEPFKHHEPNIKKDESNDTSVDFQLLFDLINEVLLDIYGNAFAHGLGFSLFGSRLQPKPVGNHLLKEVWTKISWHNSYQTQLNPTLEYISVQDFLKNDGWMNLQQDSECIGIELEDQVLDDLLDEVLLEFGTSKTQCTVS